MEPAVTREEYKEFWDYVGKSLSRLKDVVAPTNPNFLDLASEVVGHIVDAKPEVARSGTGVREEVDNETVRDLILEEFREHLSLQVRAAGRSMSENIADARRRYEEAVGQIPALHQKHFAGRLEIVVFFINFAPSPECPCRILNSDSHEIIECSGKELGKRMRQSPIFRVFEKVAESTHEELIQNVRMEIIGGIQREIYTNQPDSVLDFPECRGVIESMENGRGQRLSSDLYLPFNENIPTADINFYHTGSLRFPESFPEPFGGRLKNAALQVTGSFGVP